MEKIGEPQRPRGLVRWFYRMPLIFFRMGLGRWMGGRFLHLTHIGRVSGLPRHAVIEVVEHNAVEDTYYLASGWGKGSDWYRNIMKTPRVVAEVGSRKFQGMATAVDPEQAADLFARYGQKHPQTLQSLARIMGFRIETTEEDYRALGREIPVVAIRVDDDEPA